MKRVTTVKSFGSRIAFENATLRATLLGLALTLLVAPSRLAFGFATISAPFTAATDFVTGLPTCHFSVTKGLLGPLGIVFDGTHFFVSDFCNDGIYRFTAAGGDASEPDGFAVGNINYDLAFSAGAYYGTGSVAHKTGLYQFDPVMLTTTLVTKAFGSAPYVQGLATDPLSTDLYVSTSSGLYRVQSASSGKPTISTFAGGKTCFDGVAFSEDGTRLYAAVCGPGSGTDQVLGFDRTGKQVFKVGTGQKGVDGIAVAMSGASVSEMNVSNNIFVNGNDGTLARIDVNNKNAVTIVATGGTRGDFMTVGPDSCLYVSQSDRVEKISPCGFLQPSSYNCP